MYEIKISKTGRFCVGRFDHLGIWVHHCHYLLREKAEACCEEMTAWRAYMLALMAKDHENLRA